jgi:hypothetical protein
MVSKVIDRLSSARTAESLRSTAYSRSDKTYNGGLSRVTGPKAGLVRMKKLVERKIGSKLLSNKTF